MDDLDIEKILGIRNVSEETENIIAEKYPALSDEQKKRILSGINITDPETGTEKQVLVVRDSRKKNTACIAACAAALMIVAGAVLRFRINTTGHAGYSPDMPEVTTSLNDDHDETCPEIILNDDGTFAVPDLTGLDYDLVTERYREYFNFTTGYSNDDDIPCNQIMWQDTEPGYIAEPGYKIELNVSLGPKMNKVPPLYSFSIEEATSLLEYKGFSVMIKYVFDDDIPEGYTVKTEPEANAEAAKGSAVTLYISRGSEKEQGDVNEENGTSDDHEEVFPEETEE